MLGKLNEQDLKQTAKLLSIPVEFVRKDYFVTQAIHTLTEIEDDFFQLVFQGGTSLSKGYHAINRLSEDIDFQVTLTTAATQVGKEARRRKLRDFRHSLIDSLSSIGFLIPQKNVKVFYEGRFMSIRAEFEESEKISYLKPHILIECFVGELALPPNKIEISSLVKTVLGDQCNHSSMPVHCIALDETAAEKWVALTRRVANTIHKQRLSDKQLVRHLYDLHQLVSKKLLSGQYIEIVSNIITKDRQMFEARDAEYAKDPIAASKQAINILENDKQWETHWDTFLQQMVYDPKSPSFNEAINQLQTMSNDIFSEIGSIV